MDFSFNTLFTKDTVLAFHKTKLQNYVTVYMKNARYREAHSYCWKSCQQWQPSALDVCLSQPSLLHKVLISLSRMLSKILSSILQITKRLLMISPAKLKVKLVFLTWQASLDYMQCFSG